MDNKVAANVLLASTMNLPVGCIPLGFLKGLLFKMLPHIINTSMALKYIMQYTIGV